MKTLLLFAAVCVAVTYSQVLEPCMAPDLWEARVSRIDPEKRFSERARMSYDATNRRVRRIEEVNLLEDKEFYDVLYIHNTEPGTEYRLNLKTKECQKREMSNAWRPFQVPPNSTFLGESYIGTGAVPGAGVLTELWSNTFEDGDKYFGVYTVEGCIPIQEEFYSNRTGLVSTFFFDVTAGISDPNVFIPPRECM
ncbi:mammalian ependymin-related protein 1-like [Branchiostoma floridae]|uniref:Mammalian ependymin-related protein 1 n=1 Tax=Branchiostoma floridae TaxID=7739 RepID=A0A9J7K560_BRAFL|nr:mammalian ependymin-related protein 1-like [Branchiostoma floridae]